MNGETWDRLFTANDITTDWFFRTVQRLAGASRFGRAPRILDLGCGDGTQTFLLADLFPQSQITGLDISPANIQQAEVSLTSQPCRDRVEFVCSDYMDAHLGRHDLILADGVLHLIPYPPEALFAKLANELTEGGLLVFSIPYRCWSNSVLSAVRKTLGLCRSSLTDSLILSAARLLHGKQHTLEFLRERVHYMYHRPLVWADPTLAKTIEEGLGLGVEARERYPETSPGKFKHCIWACRKPVV